MPHTNLPKPNDISSVLDPVVFSRRVATICFCTDTFFQALSLLGEAEVSRSSPSHLYAAYSPHPYAQLGFFTVGVMAQLLWLLKLYPVLVVPGEYDGPWGGSISEREEDVSGEGSALLSEAVAEDASSDDGSQVSGRFSDEREEIDGQMLPMKPMSPNSSSKLALLPKSDAIPVIQITSASDDDLQSARSMKSDTTDDEEQEKDDTEQFIVMSERLQTKYLPHYFISTACQVGWTFAWIMRHYDLCIVFIFVNLFSQIYALFVTLEGSRNRRFPTSNIMTHITAKLRIAAAILCLWKTWGAVDIVPPPTFIEGAVNCVFFILLSGASGPDPTLGIFLALILLSLGMGRHNNIEWHLMFNWSSVIVFLFVVIDWAGGVQLRQLLWPRMSNDPEEDD